ncbi:glycoside hydrolase family 3 N-terminal domain-containing protein [Demequina zhanjiangensis]|uniref:Glycoside hydrolase family 3 N-terminal domain-containing protein n=1 Tax=Demequina zhanjiangensis TaxID=3051659 RepID=A0ABT8G141_9MICO|nr:glycoside hydrolase family 3 protein [Demequina sp. SYSU T00b26]MDN4472860.1 glycoside hydrolase family 3 N-terminal domain-containing protein [Demequina sp. SYSU T00b26]
MSTTPEGGTAARKRPRRLGPVRATAIYVLSAVLIVALIIGNSYALRYSDLISVYLGQSTQRVVSTDGDGDADYYISSFDNEADRQAYLEQVATDISREGITLLENDGALPLSTGIRVSLLGQDSVDPVFGGGGAGSVDTSQAVGFDDAFAAAGLEVNPTLWDFYDTGAGSSYRKATIDAYGQGSYAVNEVPQDVYTDEALASLDDYNDAAVVILGRSGGESSDLPTAADENGYTYLQLSAEERDMLQLASDRFDTVIVVLNAQNPVELGDLADYDVDATLWVGGLGQTGATAVAEVITGVVNPSGALTDTYAYDSLSAPAMANFGSYHFANNAEVWSQNAYLVYGEGVYMGYRYYETRYEDVVLGNEDASAYDYATQVQYPFGYGLSYTDFAWDGYTVDESDDSFQVSVEVSNTGDVAGKDIVQVYLQQPFTDYDVENGIEKSAIELAGYAKTSLLEPGASETVTVTVPKDLMATYDTDGFGTYIADAGDYYLAAGQNVHEALNNVLAAKGHSTADGMDVDGTADFAWVTTLDELDSTTFATSDVTGEPIVNQFPMTGVEAYDESFTYLSRTDWDGTWPTTYADGAWEAPQELIDAMQITVPEEDPDVETPVFDTVDPDYGELTAAMLVGEEYDSPAWDALLGQATLDELEQLVRIGGYATRGVDSIQLPATVVKDGPAGISDTLVGGESGMAYPPEIVLAATWNDELARQMGDAIGEDSIQLGVAGWYAPSTNLHRTPYSGRNFEYYSEDGLLSGRMGAAVVAGADAKGVQVFVKHFAINDQEVNRYGGAMFADEQTIREVYLPAFQMPVEDGGARGMMAAMNRIGATWVGAHEGLMTGVLRDEWGFQGVVITDQASFDVFAYEDLRQGLAAGTSLWLNTDAELWRLSDEDMTPTVQRDIVDAAHDVAFAVVNSNAMNGLAAGGRIEQVTPLWQWGLYALDAVVALGVLAMLGFTTRRLIVQRKTAEVTVES